MNCQQVKALLARDRLVYWIRERESIRLKKESGLPRPWTDDPILQSYRFCNVRRADDKVSRWLQDNWYTPYFDHKNMLLACALARFFNEPATLEVIGFPISWNPERIKRKLRDYRDQGHKLYNPAYVVRGNDGVDKIASVVDFYVGPLSKEKVTVAPYSMESTWEELNGRYGFGSFMAGQVVADLRYAVKGTWADAKTWAPMGPGSKRGLNRALNRPPNTPLKQGQFLSELMGLVNYCKTKLPSSLTNRLEMIDWQNCCCEFWKFDRALFGLGKPKQRYDG